MPAQNSAPWLKSQSWMPRGSSGGTPKYQKNIQTSSGTFRKNSTYEVAAQRRGVNRTVRSAPARIPRATARTQASADSSSVVSRPWSSQRPDSPVQSTLHLKV